MAAGRFGFGGKDKRENMIKINNIIAKKLNILEIGEKLMRKILSYILFVIVSFSLIGCSSDKEVTVSNGTYSLDIQSKDIFNPVLSISDGSFTFTYDVLSSYSNTGSYIIEDETLILTTDDGNNEYYFKIKDDSLVFQEDKSSSVELTDANQGVYISDGDVFELVTN